MAFPKQRGLQLAVGVTPSFTDFEIVNGSWKPKSNLDHEDIKDAGNKTINSEWSDPGQEATCQLVPHVGVTPLVQSDLLTESGEGGVIWEIMDVTSDVIKGKVLKQNVTLRKKDALDLTESST